MVLSAQEAREAAATIPHVGEGKLVDAQGGMALKAALETEGSRLPSVVIGTVEQELARLTGSGEIPRRDGSNVLSDAQLEAFAKRFAPGQRSHS